MGVEGGGINEVFGAEFSALLFVGETSKVSGFIYKVVYVRGGCVPEKLTYGVVGMPVPHSEAGAFGDVADEEETVMGVGTVWGTPRWFCGHHGDG